MERITVRGGRPLEGCAAVQGSKNGALPVLAACLLTRGVSVIENCPRLADTEAMTEILAALGCGVEWAGSTVAVDAATVRSAPLPRSLTSRLRSSVIVLGALLARTGSAVLAGPGGCDLGGRPVDLHLKGLRALGASVRETEEGIAADRGAHRGAEVVLSYPSVGATENLMLFAAGCQGETVIVNAAREPEICDLAAYLNRAGFSVCGAGSACIRVDGGGGHTGFVSHRVMPDRIAACTWLCAAAAARGEIELTGCRAEPIRAVTEELSRGGCRIRETDRGLFLSARRRFQAGGPLIRTGPYPCFPTDVQPMMLSVLATAEGCAAVEETVFENRFAHAAELRRLGADVETEGRVAVVRGVETLRGTDVAAQDLRGGAALVLAG
ncbi:MAG: UDP-N-acetylglucosamine 1-carboxyvinyltransferase, partial [Oscillospiraceae bacterium]|nr:UDP-N-acetylglucosamine 1-carboxyvinyltransferase [Oscillospiraceae bacterium]